LITKTVLTLICDGHGNGCGDAGEAAKDISESKLNGPASWKKWEVQKEETVLE